MSEGTVSVSTLGSIKVSVPFWSIKVTLFLTSISGKISEKKGTLQMRTVGYVPFLLYKITGRRGDIPGMPSRSLSWIVCSSAKLSGQGLASKGICIGGKEPSGGKQPVGVCGGSGLTFDSGSLLFMQLTSSDKTWHSFSREDVLRMFRSADSRKGYV